MSRREYMREWAANNKERRRDYWRAHRLKHKYGLSPEEFADLQAKQDNKCAICGCVLEDRTSTHIDHNHKTGEVRGLLCRPCNMMLGKARDNPDILEAGVKYLREKGHYGKANII